ncbi:hypothetical protein AKJ65_08055, partial [candidate division MSBL1 archaeon SCGC-AAA259E19]
FTDTHIIPKSRWEGLLDQYGSDIVSATPNIDDPDAMNGSGPYTLEISNSDRAVLKRVEGYWDEEIGWYYLPEYVDHYFYGALLGGEGMLNEGYRNHGTDWGQVCYNYPSFYKDRMDYMLTWDIDGPESGMWYHEASMLVIVPNWGKEIFRETYPWLLKALNYATDDRAAMEAGFFGGSCLDPPTYLHPDLPNYEELVNTEVLRETYPELKVGYKGHLYIPYDPKLAVEILDNHCEGSVDEGWTYNGKKLGGWTIQAVKGWHDLENLVKEIAKDWSEIGIKTDPKYPQVRKLVKQLGYRELRLYSGLVLELSGRQSSSTHIRGKLHFAVDPWPRRQFRDMVRRGYLPVRKVLQRELSAARKHRQAG